MVGALVSELNIVLKRLKNYAVSFILTSIINRFNGSSQSSYVRLVVLRHII